MQLKKYIYFSKLEKVILIIAVIASISDKILAIVMKGFESILKEEANPAN